MLETIEQKIKSVAESIDGVKYIYMNWAQANVELDNVDMPTIVYVLPASGDLNFTYARVYDNPETQIAFLAPTELDFEGAKNNDIVEQMKRLCIRFVKKLNESGLFELVDGRIPYRVVYDYLDRNVTGISVEFRLEEIGGVSICDLESRENDEA